MLVELRIRDYAVIEDLRVTLGPGLNALTGETGAGKSIIVGALSLLLGERASSGVVRSGADRATVEGVFDVSSLPEVTDRLEELGYRTEEGLLILRREVAAAGRNRAWVNGSPATAGVVGELGNALVDLHGQHEHQALLRSGEQRRILDAFGGGAEESGRLSELHARVRGLQAELEQREARLREVESKADFLRFQLEEVASAKLSPGEDRDLEAEARRLEHGEELTQGATRLYEELYGADGSVTDRIGEARRLLARLIPFDSSLESLGPMLDEAFHALSEAGRHAADYASALDHDPGRLDEIRSRLDRIFRLKRKYGPELDDVLATGERLSAELAELDDADHDLDRARAELRSARESLEEAARDVTELRRRAGAALGAAVEGVLPDLGLPGAAFQVRLRALEEIGPSGAESVEFLVTTNPGFEPMPLARIASGGELSRIMLALKSILAGLDRVPVLVFDEIDAGIGGAVATAVAEKLAGVASDHQVFVVTHLAQLAARAAGHLLVEKDQHAGLASTRVDRLEGPDRVREVARMLGGDPDSPTSREHARELLASR